MACDIVVASPLVRSSSAPVQCVAGGGHPITSAYSVGSTGYYISATPPPNIMTAARGHGKPSRASANVKGGEIASVLPGEYRVLNFST